MSLLKRLLLPQPHNNHRAKVRHPAGLAWLSIFSLLVPLWLHLASQTHPQILGYASSIPAARLIELTNNERAKQGLNPLQTESKLTAAAQAKAQDMFAQNYWAHVSPSGAQPWVFFTNAGYSYMYAGENLARDFSDPESIVSAWMASPTHRDNILNAQFQEIGIAVVDGTLNGVETTLVVQHFGRPRVSTASVQAAKTTADTNTAVQAELPADTTQPVELETPIVESVAEPVPALDIDTQLPAHAMDIPVSQPAAFSPLDFAKSWNLAVVGILLFALLAETFIVWHKRIPRISGRPLAHLLLVGTLMATILYTQSGLIK